MRRILVWPLALLIALATGAAVGQAVDLAASPVPATFSGEATVEVVRAFYDAANSVIQTGDVSALDTVVAPDFVDHTGFPGLSPDRDGLGRYLAALHGVSPDTRLTSDDVFADGDRAMARVAGDGPTGAAFLGIAVGGRVTVWSDADVFRVANRRVVERWGGPAATVAFDRLGRGSIGTSLPSNAGLALERIVLPPGGQIQGPAQESRLVEVETGNLTVAVDTTSIGSADVLSPDPNATSDGSRRLEPGSGATLATGGLIALPVSTSYLLSNAGPESSTLLVASFFPADDPKRAAPPSDPSLPSDAGPWPSNLDVQPLAGGSVTNLPPVSVTAGIGRMILAPGAWLSALTTTGPLLGVVESGTLDFAMSDGTVWVRTGSNGASRDRAAGSLQAGDGALLPPDATFSLRNSGDAPAVVLVVAITPND
jgi:predicted ester cyclase